MMNRRRFLLSLPALALLPRLISAAEPDLYDVEYSTAPDGTRCVLQWDGKQHFRALCGPRSKDYIHPRPWHGLDAEFYRMQGIAQTLPRQLQSEGR
jgi:hypothetical protein